MIDQSNHFGSIQLKTVPYARIKVQCVCLQIGLKSFLPAGSSGAPVVMIS